MNHPTAETALIIDIDGPFVTYPKGAHVNRDNRFNPDAIAAFRRIMAHVQPTHLVLSSQRRLTERKHAEIKAMWNEAGLRPFDDTTIIYPQQGIIIPAFPRGREIAMWLAEHPEVKVWAVIDDDLLGINEILDMDRVVICRPEIGLTPVGAERVIHILSNNVPTPTPPLAPVYSDSEL